MDLEILKIASNTENHKTVKNHTHLSKNKNSICGDEMEISLLIKNDLIKDIGYQCKSCVYCQASASLLSRKIKNKKVNQIEDLIYSIEFFFDNTEIKIKNEWKDFQKIFNKKNISRKDCLLLPLRTTSKALNIKK
tara:strand:+ start:419 stop:823 length:405 start_codon:yes stop_codon:yes gene_type:complete